MPQQLVKVGKVIDQIAYDKELYPVTRKNAPVPTERPHFVQSGPYCLDLDSVSTTGVRQQQNKHNNQKQCKHRTQTQNQTKPKRQNKDKNKCKNKTLSQRHSRCTEKEIEDSSQSRIGDEDTSSKARWSSILPTRGTSLIAALSSHAPREKSIVLPATGGGTRMHPSNRLGLVENVIGRSRSNIWSPKHHLMRSQS